MTHWAQSIIHNNLKTRGENTVTRGTLTVETRPFHSLPEMSQKMRSCPGQGWCALTDRIENIQSGQWPQEHVLIAERVDGLTSYHLRWNGQFWQLSIISRRDTGQDWIFTHKLARIGGGSLTYEVAWTLDTQGIFRPSISRLAAIHNEETFA